MNRFTTLAVVAGIAFAPNAAHAQSCYSLRLDRNSLDAASVRLLAEYPGTNLVIGMCGATALDTYNHHIARGMRVADAEFEAGATFTACAIFGCVLAGFGRCIEVSARWFEINLHYRQVQQEMARLGCRP